MIFKKKNNYYFQNIMSKIVLSFMKINETLKKTQIKV